MKTRSFRILILLTLALALYGCGGGGEESTPGLPAPTITAFQMPANADSRISVPVTAFTATDSDGGGVTGFKITPTDKTPDPYGPGWTAWAPVSYTFPNAGPQTAYAWTRNKVGGVSSPRSVTVVMPGAPAGQAVNGVVRDPANNDVPLSGAVVKAYLHGQDIPASAAFVTSGTNGSFSLPGLSATVPYDLVFSKTGYRDITYFNITPDLSVVKVLPETVRMLANSTIGQKVNMYGYVKDAADYNGFKVRLQYRVGYNATDTTVESMSKPTDLGYFNRTGDSSVDAGIYTAEVIDFTAEPFVTRGYFTVFAVPGAPSLNNSQYYEVPRPGTTGTTVNKAVLNWGSAIADLDLIMTGPIVGGADRFHVDFSQFAYPAGSSTSSDPIVPGALTDAYLDVNSFLHGADNAPETVTIVNKKTGIYKFYVYNRSDTGSFASAGAKVTFYTGSISTKKSFTAPSGTGNLWHVFDLDGATVTTVNTLETWIGEPNGAVSKQLAGIEFEEYFLLRPVLNKTGR